jgi:hypothetical protein
MRTHTLEPVKVVTPEIRSDKSGGIQLGAEKGIYVHDDGIVDMEMQSGCYVQLSSDQNISNATDALMQFGSEIIDKQNEWNSSTYTFTASKNGVYQCSICLDFRENITDGKYVNIQIYKNLAQGAFARYLNGATQRMGGAVSMMIDLDENDTISFYVRHASGSARKLEADNTFCSVVKVG